jgi:hypothetical protein
MSRATLWSLTVDTPSLDIRQVVPDFRVTSTGLTLVRDFLHGTPRDAQLAAG